MYTVNGRILALIFGITRQSLTAWIAEGMPVHKKGTAGEEYEFIPADCIQWHEQRTLNKTKARTPRDVLDQVRAQREHLALQRDKRELIPESEIVPALDAYIDDVLGVIEALPERYALLSAEAHGAEAHVQLWKTAVREIRAALGNHEFCIAADREESAEVSSAARH